MKLKAERIEGSLRAGVCAGIAQALQWNVWVLRALFVAFLPRRVYASMGCARSCAMSWV